MSENSKSQSLFKMLLRAIFAVVVIFIIFNVFSHAGVDQSSANSSQASSNDDDSITPSQRMARSRQYTVSELTKDFDKNEIAVNDNIAGREVTITGTISSIRLDFMNNPVLELRGPDEWHNASAYLKPDYKEQAAKLNKGDRVQVICSGASFVMHSVSAKDCEIFEQ